MRDDGEVADAGLVDGKHRGQAAVTVAGRRGILRAFAAARTVLN